MAKLELNPSLRPFALPGAFPESVGFLPEPTNSESESEIAPETESGGDAKTEAEPCCGPEPLPWPGLFPPLLLRSENRGYRPSIPYLLILLYRLVFGTCSTFATWLLLPRAWTSALRIISFSSRSVASLSVRFASSFSRA